MGTIGPNDEVVVRVPLHGGREIVVRVNPCGESVSVVGAKRVDVHHRFRVGNDVAENDPDDGIIVRSEFHFYDQVQVEVHREQGEKWWWYPELPRLTFKIGHRDGIRLQDKIRGWFKMGSKEDRDLGFAPDRVPAEQTETISQ